jgi:hypothetical protein
LAGVYGFLYVTHISKLQHSVLRQTADAGMVFIEYQPGDSRVRFVGSHTLDFFHYLFGHVSIGVIGLLLFAGGWILLGRVPAGFSRRRGELRLILAAPFAIAWAAALARLFPFGGSRHTIYIAPFILLGVAVALATVAAWLMRRWHVLARPEFQIGAAVILSLLICSAAERHVWRHEIVPQEMRNIDFEKAVDYVRAHVPKGGMILADRAHSKRLALYLDSVSPFSGEPFSFDSLGTNYTPQPAWEFQELDRGGYRIISWREIFFSRSNVLDAVQHFARAYHLTSSQSVWIFGWRAFPRLRVYEMFTSSFPEGRIRGGIVGPYYVLDIPADLAINGREVKKRSTPY